MIQKAIVIQTIEPFLSSKEIHKFREFIHEHCCPLVEFYDENRSHKNDDDYLNDLVYETKVCSDLRTEVYIRWDAHHNNNGEVEDP